ncbi:MAG: hypothetical protein JSS89_01345 [Bacteroidetes bacterium]|nr:hypothetical protein [Bacteroidota bacterium]
MQLRSSFVTLLRSAPLLLMLTVMLVACSKDVAPTGPTDSKVNVSGRIENPLGLELPSTTKLIVVWSISTGSPDRSYIYVPSSPTRTKDSFGFWIPDSLADIACNTRGTNPSDSLYMRGGVGFIVLVDDPDALLKDGLVLSGPSGDSVLTHRTFLKGAVDNSALIYRKGSSKAVSAWRPWLDTFPKGFTLGRGVPMDVGFDIFVPYATSEKPVLRIDTSAKSFTFPNWT